ncbi:MAG: hypothetical protein ABL977_00575 [Candidatus Eisenbacteria bacterium]
MHLGGQADTLVVAPGATFTVELRTLQPGDAFNAFDIGLLYDSRMVAFTPTSPLSTQRGALMVSACAATFHRFSAQPESLAITLVMLCSDATVSGADALYKVRFTAGATAGWTRLRFGRNTQFFMGGTYVPLARAREIVVKIGSPVLGVDAPGTPGGAARVALAPPEPNPARAGQPLNVAFTLPGPDDVALELMDAQGRRVAERVSERFAGGAHRLAWAPGRVPPGRYVLRVRSAQGAGAARGWVVLR